MVIFRFVMLIVLVVASLLAATISGVLVLVAYGCRILPLKRDQSDLRAMESVGVSPLVRAKPGNRN